MRSLTINARYKNRPVTGVERFATEVANGLRGRDLVSREIDPGRQLAGIKGHAWEQFVLPAKMFAGKNEILLSPCNTGPVAVKNQFVVIHDAAVWDYPEGFSRSFGTLYRNLLPALAKRCCRVGTVSEFSRSRLAEYLKLPENEIVVLGNATSSAFRPAPTQRADQAPRFFCVCSLDPRKNFSKLISAWQALQKAGSLPEGTTLRIAGGANPRNFSSVTLEESDTVKWLGRISDGELIREYQQATAFIFPSLYEGFGLPPLEAMACGCPVLLSRCASLPEVGGTEFDRKNEGAVLYFDPSDTDSISAAINNFLSLNGQEIDALSANAVKRSGEFSWSAVTDKIVQSLED